MMTIQMLIVLSEEDEEGEEGEKEEGEKEEDESRA